MYIVTHHQIKDPSAFVRGQKLIRGEGAPDGARPLQFYPTKDGSQVFCLWEAQDMQDVQDYVDEVLGDSSHNRNWEVDSEHAFATQPLGLPETAPVLT